ncbi:HNH endonuclease signature motif containing protein [Hoeflea alexandrii]|uniref:HNH endonuclease signature motif containing protein n=1 Tax=Hoeflea alexandrii TaxID=288436 RepID=UPI0035CF6834
MKGHPIIYSDAELAWIKANGSRSRREAHAEFCWRFERDDVTLGAFASLCKRNGWLTGRDGRYPSGNVPANKGKKMPFNANSAKTQFKSGQVPHNHVGAGHERIDPKDGYVIMIVDEVNPWTGAATRPVHKHRWLWEQANGPIPEGHILKCLDGDKTNCEPSNWEPIPRAILPYLQGRHSIDYEAAEPEVKPTVLAIAKVRHKAKAAVRS